jgi:polyhydroxybutyrate depolymerase
VQVGDTTRSYVVRLPANYTGTSAVPLVLDFHPIAGSPSAEANASGYRELAEQQGFIVAWPQGIDDAWNIGPCCTTSRTVDDMGFSRALVQRLEQDACIDPKRVYATGFSMGGGMALYLGCNAADVFAAIAPSGFDLAVDSEIPCQPVRPVTEISFRGTADLVVPYAGGATQPPNGLNVTVTFLGAVGTFQRWAELDQCTGSPSAADANGCSTYDNCQGGTQVTLCTAQGGGAAWGSAAIGWSVLQAHPMP